MPKNVLPLRETWTAADANALVLHAGRPDQVDNASAPDKVLAVTGTAVIDNEDIAAWMRGFGLKPV